MEGEKRKSIEAVLKHYQDCQSSGLKDVERQMEIYSDDSQFIVFPVAGVLGVTGPRILKDKQAIRELFEQYNKHASTFDSVSIIHKNHMIDPEALKGSFVMEITMIKDGKRHQYMNYLQMQLNEEMQVISSLNWQADVTEGQVF